MARNTTRNSGTTANLGFEARLGATAYALRNTMDAAKYKHVVLGLICLKYISDASYPRWLTYLGIHAHINTAASKAMTSGRV